MINENYKKAREELRKIATFNVDKIKEVAAKYSISYQLAEYYWNYRNEQ